MPLSLLAGKRPARKELYFIQRGFLGLDTSSPVICHGTRSRSRLLRPGAQPCISISAMRVMGRRWEGAWAASPRALGRRMGLTPWSEPCPSSELQAALTAEHKLNFGGCCFA